MSDYTVRFVQYLVDLHQKEEAGKSRRKIKLSWLTRVKGPPARSTHAQTIVKSWVGSKASPEVAQTYPEIAVLFARHPMYAAGGNWGEHCNQVITLAHTITLETVFSQMLTAERSALFPFVNRILTTYLAPHRIPVDYPRLMRDLWGWSHQNQYVQNHWKTSFSRLK